MFSIACKKGVIIYYIEQVWYYECIDWCLYQVVFFFIFCKDDSKMLRLSKKLSNFSMMTVLQRNVTAANPPSQPPTAVYMTFLVGKIDM